MEYKRTSEPFIAEKPFRKSTNGNHQADKLGEFIVYSKPRLEQKVRQEKFFKSLRSKHPP
jgi:hypothetical protein